MNINKNTEDKKKYKWFEWKNFRDTNLMEKHINERVLSAFSHLVDLLFRVKPHSKWKLLYLFYKITWFRVDAARTLIHMYIFFDGQWVHSYTYSYLVNFNQRVDYSWRFEMINYTITLLLWDDLMANVVAFYMFLTIVLYLLCISICIWCYTYYCLNDYSHCQSYSSSSFFPSSNRFVLKCFIFLFIFISSHSKSRGKLIIRVFQPLLSSIMIRILILANQRSIYGNG